MPKYNSVDHLTPREERFCEEYLINGKNARQAGLAAGYSLQTANSHGLTLLKMSKIQKYLSKKEKAVCRVTCIDYNYKVRKLGEIVQKYLPEGDGPIDQETSKVRLYLEYVKIAIAAIQELNKMQGDYAAEKRANVNFNVDADLTKIKEVMDGLMVKYKREY